MINRKLVKILKHIAVICGISIISCIAGSKTVSASTFLTQNAESDTAITTATTKEEIDAIVANGEFDSSKLTIEQINHIYSLYNNDPETITQLQKRSDSNMMSPELYTTYKHSAMFNGYTVVDGIDVSEWNGEINWNKVKASGIDYAIIRVGGRYYQGGGYFTDDSYKENIEGALEAGLDVGVYFFSAAITTAEAKEEAAYTMKLIKNYNITLPVVMDFEYGPGPSGRLYDAKLTKNQVTKIVTAFCDSVENKGYVGMIYASKSVLDNDMDAVALAKKYPVWNAQYNEEDTLTSKHSYWQYSSTGKVRGIENDTDLNYRYIKKPVAVTNLTYTPTDSSITLSWSKIPEVYGYQVVRYDETTDSYVSLGTVKGAKKTTFTDSGLPDGTTYKYKVRAYYKLSNGNIFGTYSEEFSATTISDQVKNVKLNDITNKSVRITWTEKGTVSGYRVLRSTASSRNYVLVNTINNAATNSYSDKNLDGGTMYNYKIQAFTIEEDGTITYHSPSDAASGRTLPGKVKGFTTVDSTSNSVTISWNRQLNVDGYKLYKLNTSTGKWELLAKLKGPSRNKYTLKDLKPNKPYKFSVIAYYSVDGKTKTTSRSDTFVSYTGLVPVSSLKTASRTKSSITVSWKEMPKASGYNIYVFDTKTKSDILVGQVTKGNACEYTVSDLPTGRSRKITVKPFKTRKGVSYYGTGTTITSYTSPVAPTSVSYKNYKNNTLLTWSRVKGTAGYMIYKYNSTCTKRTLIATLKGAGKTTYVAPKLSDGETYRVVTYLNANGKKITSNRSKAPSLIEGKLSGVVTAGVVNVRANAGTNYNIITEAKYNQALQIKGVKNVYGTTWYKVTFTKGKKTYTGYISGDYVKIQ